jgi:bifunctional non-homologous end joining protein LigD
VVLPAFTPAELTRLPAAFDDDEFVFELKMDGFRAMAYVDGAKARFVSRKQHTYKGFGPLYAAVHSCLQREAVIDGEVVCLDAEGSPEFYMLLWRRGQPVFYAVFAGETNVVASQSAASSGLNH